MSEPTATALLIDDDPSALALLRHVLETRCPTLRIECRTAPDPGGSFDVIFVDNEMDGQYVAAGLASALRRRNPNALVLAYSATLEEATLKGLINAGCSGAFDKSVPDDLTKALDVVDAYLLKLSEPRGRGFLGAIQSIKDLLREWNTRLDDQELELASLRAAPEEKSDR